MSDVASLLKKAKLPEKVASIVFELFSSYQTTLEHSPEYGRDYVDAIFTTLIDLVEKQIASPAHFGFYHQATRAPFDYYAYGLKFVAPLISSCYVSGWHHVETIDRLLSENKNVILLANHQSELDPQAISVALQEKFPKLGVEMIFVAGDRVVSDPIAVPFSLGRNLLCIYSKRHIAHPPEKKMEKQIHNQRTMKVMKEMLSQGGRCIYVAPSGGRDRMNAQGEIPVADFDPNNIEMFRLIAEQSKHPTHFFPLALVTHDLLPPPRAIESELGEMRSVNRKEALFAFGEEIDTKHFPGVEGICDRLERRKAFADHVYKIVAESYAHLRSKK